MAYYSKEIYERKQRYAERKMRQNAEIDSLTEEQHDALATLCTFRHKFHLMNVSYLINSEATDDGLLKMIDDEYGEPEINVALEKAGLEPIPFPSSIDLPTDFDWFECMTEEEKAEYKDFNDFCNNCADKWFEYKEKVNTLIEQYLKKIDREHGTEYCPTGVGRFIPCQEQSQE